MALSLVLGFSAAQALDGTLYIQSNIRHPQSGQKITIDFGTYVFDVFRDRRELASEIINVCKNPPEKIKTFLNNRAKASSWNVEMYFKYHHPIEGELLMFRCEYDKAKLVEWRNKSDNTISLSTITNDVSSLNGIFAMFIDSARADAKQKGVSFTTPSKTITIKFGTQTINPETGAEGIATYPSLDYEFNVYDDRRELIRKVWESCGKLQANMREQVYKYNNNNPTISIWYDESNKGLAEFYSLKCKFDGKGELYNVGNMDSDTIQRLDTLSVGGKKFNDKIMTLIDIATSNSNTSQNTKTKAK